MSSHPPDRTPLPYGPAASWRRLTLGLLVLGALELLAGHLIVARRLGETAALAFDVLLGLGTVALLAVIASPLWATAWIEHGRRQVVVGFGLLGRAQIPLAAIISVEEHRPRRFEQVDPGAAVAGDPPRATFSRGGGGGYVRMRLAEPVWVRHGVWRKGPAAEFVLQSADPTVAVAAISTAIRQVPPD